MDIITLIIFETVDFKNKKGSGFFSVLRRRDSLGFPDKKTTEMWLDPAISTPFPPKTLVVMNSLKNSEIPILNNYEISADESFWEKFPKRSLPAKASTRVNVEALRSHVEVKSKMSRTEVSRVEKVLLDLAEGASAYQKVQLPPLNSVNSRSATENGILLTDTIATWVKKGFVAGPFDTPPLAGFIANPLAAVVRIVKSGLFLICLGLKGPVSMITLIKRSWKGYIWEPPYSLDSASKQRERMQSSQV